MNHEDPQSKNPITTEETSPKNPEDTTPQTEESLRTPPPPPTPIPRELLSIKRWSENKQRYYYKPKDPDYAKKHYWKHKHDMQCTTCGAVVSTAMFRHVKTLRCLMVKDRVQKALNEQVETSRPPVSQ
jgi:hypothetical protein